MAEERVERRLAAILAADVVGYSRLMSEDEEGTLGALNAHLKELIEPLISSQNGRIVKTTGDGLLVEFSSVIDAVHFAVAFQNGMAERNLDVSKDRRIEFRIGINIGDVIIQDDDVFGDGVNVAARLESLADPGGICVSRAARDQIRDKLHYGLRDLGEVEVKNIARPVRVFQLLPDSSKTTSHRRSRIKKGRLAFTAVLAFVIAAGAGLWVWQPWADQTVRARPERIAYALPNKPSIAILPFANLSGDKQQEYFADGITEDLITDLAQSKEIFVIARNSTFAYKGRNVPIREVAEELGVRYVLEGSIRRIGENMRITAQLIDATNGAHVWAKRYDEPADKLFEIQDQLNREIAGTLLSNIRKSALAKLTQKRAQNFSAYDYVLRARAKFDQPGKAAKLEARALAQKAIEIDPDYAPAYAVLGDTFNSGYIVQWEGPESLEKAFEAARTAVRLDPMLSTGQELLGRVLLRRGQHDLAIAAIKKAVELNPNRARHYGSLADSLTFADRPKEAIELMKTAMRLDPFFPARHNMYLGRAYFFDRQFEQAVGQLEACATRAPKWRPCYMYLAPALAELGKSDEAQKAVRTLLLLAPRFSIARSVRNHLPFVPPAMRFYVQALQKAGIPE